MEIASRGNSARVWRAVAGILAAAAACCGGAQTGLAAGAAAASTNDNGALDEIIVTARRREENLQNVPISITSSSVADLAEKGIKTLDDLQFTVPGLAVQEQRDRNSTEIGIRGIKSNEISSDQQKVTTLYDGLPTIGTQSVTQFTDIDRVEVYRGPQSAEFGRSVFAGAVNYISTPANLQEFHGRADATYGTDGIASGSLLVTGPIITDKLAVLVAMHEDNYDGPGNFNGQSGTVTSSDGYRLGGTHSRYFSSKIAFKPMDGVEFTLRYQHLDTDDEPSADYNLDTSGSQFGFLSPSVAPLVNPLTSAKDVIGKVDFAPPATAFNRNFCFPGNAVIPTPSCITDPSNRINRNRYTAGLEIDAWDDSHITARGFYSTELQTRRDDSDRTSLVPYRNPLNGQVVNPVNDEYDYLPIKERYGELVWASRSDARLRGLVGVSYYSYDFLTYLYFNVNPDVLSQQFSDDTRNEGVYGSLQYDLTSAVTLSAEARYQQDTVTGYNEGPPVVPVEMRTDSFLPRISATWKINPDFSAYAQVAEGDNPGGVNPDVITPLKQQIAELAGTATALDSFLKYKEEKLWNYEIGVKGDALDRKLTYTAAVYVMDWQNFQNTTNVPFAPVGSFVGQGNPPVPPGLPPPFYSSRDVFNEGDVHGRGLELSAQYRPNRMFAADFAYSHNQMKYAAACAPGIVQYGFALQAGSAFPCVNVAGKIVPLNSADTVDLGFSVTADYSNGMSWTNRIQGYYVSKQYLDESNLNWIGPKVDAGFRSMLSRGHTMVTFFINNLTDDRTPTTAAATPNSGLAYVLANPQTRGPSPGLTGFTANTVAPREYGVTINYKF
jgi:iron complex outermembrane receptor protein